MLIYFLVFLATMLIVWSFPDRTDRQFKWKLFFSFIPLFLFGALREGFNDQDTYEQYFDDVHKFEDITKVNEHMEEGYYYLNLYFPNFRLLIIAISVLQCFAFAYAFYKYIPKNYIWFAFLLLFASGNNTIFFQLSTMRNGITVLALLLLTGLIYKRKWIIYIISSLVLYYIHSSVVFTYPIAFLYGMSHRFKKREFLYWLSAIVLFFIITASSILETSAPFINEYLNRYDSVLKTIQDTDQAYHWTAIIGGSILFYFFFSYIQNEKKAINLPIIRISAFFIFSFFLGPLNARLTQYFVPFFILASTIMVANWKGPKKMIYGVYVTVFLLYSFILWTQGEWFVYDTYQSVLD